MRKQPHLTERKVFIIDFLILTFLFLAISSAVFLVSGLLYPEEEHAEYLLKIKTLPMKEEFCSLINEGDELFDSITKRYIGRVIHTSRQGDAEEAVMIIEISAIRNPRGHPLRSRQVWFEYELTE